MNQIKEKFPFSDCHRCENCVIKVEKDPNWNDVVTCKNAKECVKNWIKEMEEK